jgi:shikimate kinase
MSMLFLIGMPASGKTYWGRKIAEHYQLPFADLDEYIEQQAGMTISKLFEQHGEAHFRERERKVLQYLIQENKARIIACGGGTPLFFDNLQIMKAAGCIAYLSAEIQTLQKHINNDKVERPLLKGSVDMEQKLRDMQEERMNVYIQADYFLETEQLSITNFANIINTCINQHS